MKLNKKKKAFTLTELLVVVIIIGVLSAVVLPKFNKIVETRKTTEAEELMAAVRTEQEKRCALDKDYLTEVTKLTEVLPTDTTKNFTYTLTSTGIKASSKGKYAYELQMPSYADGRICCENETECLKLNKDYPLCSELLAKADYDDGTACAGEELQEPTCTKQPYEEDCPAGQTGKISYTVNSDCEYEISNTCTAEEPAGCTAGEWVTATTTMEQFRNLLQNDCTQTQGLSGSASGAVDVNSVTGSCTDYSAISVNTSRLEASGGSDTCNYSLNSYSCDSSSPNQCIDIVTQSGPNGFVTAAASVNCRCTIGGSTYGGGSSSSGSGSGGGSSSSSGANCTTTFAGYVATTSSGGDNTSVSYCSGVSESQGTDACLAYLEKESGSTIQGGFKCLYRLGTGDCETSAASRARQGRDFCGTTAGSAYMGCYNGNGGWGEDFGSANGATALKCASANRYKVTCSQLYQYRTITCK